MTEYCPVCRNELRTGQQVRDAELPLNPLTKVWVPVHADPCAHLISDDPDALSRTIDLLKGDQAFLDRLQEKIAAHDQARALRRN